jgi:hypothetical protein
MLETLPWEVAYLRDLEFLGLDGNPIMKPNPYLASLDQLNPQIQDVLKSMRYENPAAEMLYREGPVGMVSWLRDQMPPEIMVPLPIPKRRWIRRAKPQAEKGLFSLGI